MKPIILFKKGTISVVDKKRINLSGFCAVEVPEPSEVVMMLPNCTEVKGDLITTSALKALSGQHSSNEREKFGAEIISKLTK